MDPVDLPRIDYLFGSMYAVRTPGEIYHLLKTDTKLTLCGLSVSMPLVESTRKESRLHRVVEKPRHRRLCKNCGDRVKE